MTTFDGVGGTELNTTRSLTDRPGRHRRATNGLYLATLPLAVYDGWKEIDNGRSLCPTPVIPTNGPHGDLGAGPGQ